MANELSYKLSELIKDAKRISSWHKYDEDKTIVDHFIKNDVLPVIRCKDCAYANDYGTVCHYGVGRSVRPDHYCGWAERRNTNE
jgi:hypothetical protein